MIIVHSREEYVRLRVVKVVPRGVYCWFGVREDFASFSDVYPDLPEHQRKVLHLNTYGSWTKQLAETLLPLLQHIQGIVTLVQQYVVSNKMEHSQTGDYLDAKDCAGNWWVARVTREVSTDQRRVHFVGWANDHDEVVPLTQLAPLGMMTSKGASGVFLC
jgi:hypothetical protein